MQLITVKFKSATIHLRIGRIIDECSFRIVDWLKTEMVLGFRVLQKHNCVIGLQTNQLWTTPLESNIIPLNSGNFWGKLQNGNRKPTHEAEAKKAVNEILEKVSKKRDQVETMKASGSICENDDDDILRLIREEEEETPTVTENKSQQISCLKPMG